MDELNPERSVGDRNPEEMRRGPEEIRLEIERTRERLDSTMSALEEKLSPTQLIDEAWDKAMDRLQGSDGSNSVLSFAWRHPLPLAVVGIGLGWLAVESARARREASHPSSGASEEEGKKPLFENRGLETGGHGARGHESGGHEGPDWSSDDSDDEEPSGRLRRMGSKAASGVRLTGRKVRESVDVNPLAAGAIAFGIGLLSGLSLPPSGVENRVMGRTSDRLREQANDAGLEAAHRAKDAAKMAAQRTTDAAKSAVRDAADQML
jgi:hypothetical protein